MTAITFDTLKYANRLKAAGIDPKHAEAEAKPCLKYWISIYKR